MYYLPHVPFTICICALHCENILSKENRPTKKYGITFSYLYFTSVKTFTFNWYPKFVRDVILDESYCSLFLQVSTTIISVFFLKCTQIFMKNGFWHNCRDTFHF